MNIQRLRLWAPYLLFCCYSFSLKTLASCYFPNGTDRNLLLSSEVYQPCNAGDEDSMCCALNRGAADKCRSDGLCLSTFDHNIWRGSCTDRDWKSSKCFKLCNTGTGQYIEGIDIQLANNDATITPCADGSYCCGNGTASQTCCDKKNGVFLSNDETTSNNRSVTSSSASEFSTSTPANSPSTTSPRATTSAFNAQASTSSKNNTGVIVGGVIGGIGCLALIVGVILIFNVRRKLGTMSKSQESQPPAPHEVFGTDARELDARPMQELDAGENFQELDSGTGFREAQ